VLDLFGKDDVKHTVNFTPTGTSHEIEVRLRSGKALEKEYSEKERDAKLALLRRIAPWAIVGSLDLRLRLAMNGCPCLRTSVLTHSSVGRGSDQVFASVSRGTETTKPCCNLQIKQERISFRCVFRCVATL
jgi:hypothetical protein